MYSIILILCLVFLSVYLTWWLLVRGRPIGIKFIATEFPYIFGNFKGKQFALQLANLYQLYPRPIVGVSLFFPTQALIISDLNLVKLVLSEKFSYFQNRGLFYNEKDDPLSAILGTVEHAAWQPMRKKLTGAFKSSQMKNIFPQIKNMCDELCEHLNEMIVGDAEVIVKIIDKFSKFTTDTIGAVAFGNHCEESAAQLREMVAKSKKPYLKYPFNRFVVAFPRLARWLRMRKHSKEVSDFFVNFVAKIVVDRKRNNVRYNDFMQSWIDAGLDIHRIAAIAFDLLSAGYADSTSTLAYCLYELAMNKNIQDKARAEIRSVLGNKELTYDILPEMSYCLRIMKEAERKYPVAGIATRVATKCFQVPDTDITIPCGMKIFIPIYAIHHDANYFPDPEVFDPDRFTEEAKNQRPKCSFLPFGAGPRQCIGYKFAEMLIATGLVSLLQDFEFSTCELTQVPMEFNEHKNTLHPKNGVTLKLRRI